MKKDREIMHNDKKDSELIAEYYDKYEQKLYRLSYWEIYGRRRRLYRRHF